ncbi:MAG: TIR domain-containing protein [bacterium]|nr:TIR domain-containing protein [bacterium]
MNSVDIFLSYSHEDEERTRVVADALRDCGWSVWWDKNVPAGRGYREFIADVLANSRCVVVLWSHSSVKSDWVHDEADLGKRKRRLVPIFIDSVAAPLGFMSLQGPQLLDLPSAIPAEALDALHQSIAALIGDPTGDGAGQLLGPAEAISTRGPFRVVPDRTATGSVSTGTGTRTNGSSGAKGRTRALIAGTALALIGLVAWAAYRADHPNERVIEERSRVPAAAAPVFSALAPMPTPLSMVSGTAVRGVFLVIGGHDGNRDGNEFNAYHPETNTWTALQPLPDWRYQSSGAVAMRGRLYLVGGWDNREGSRLPHDDVFEYDPATGVWAVATTLPTLSGGGASGVINGKLYVLTAQNGYSTPAYVHTLHVWSPRDDSWKELRGSTVIHVTPASGVIDNKLYVVGGQNGDGTGAITDVLEAYDPATDAWTVLAPMPDPTNGAAGAVINGLLYVIGGNTGSGDTNAVSVYDPATDSWSRSTPMPSARCSMASGVIGNTAYLAGGRNASWSLSTLESMRVPFGGERAP